MPLKRVAIPTTTYSSRAGTPVTTIVCHTAEGASNYVDLGHFFQNSAGTANPTSSHVGIDDTPNTVGEYVPRTGAAWTAGAANSWSVQAELCAFAAWTPADWSAHPTMLANLAAWIAEEAAYFGIPIVALSPEQAQNPTARGVAQHIDLGQMGGGHVDCDYGTGNFPMSQVLDMAAGRPPVNLEEDHVTSYFVNNQHHVFAQRSDGTVDHWWMDLGAKPLAWRVETLPRAA